MRLDGFGRVCRDSNQVNMSILKLAFLFSHFSLSQLIYHIVYAVNFNPVLLQPSTPHYSTCPTSFPLNTPLEISSCNALDILWLCIP
jgi:hypothetical protein